MAWAAGLMGKAGAGVAGKAIAGPPLKNGAMSASKGLLGGMDEGMLGAMMQRGASGGGGKQAYQEGLTGGMSALQGYQDMSRIGERSALDPQMVFGMMNNMQHKPGQRQFVKPQWTPNNRRQQNRGLI